MTLSRDCRADVLLQKKHCRAPEINSTSELAQMELLSGKIAFECERIVLSLFVQRLKRLSEKHNCVG